MTQGGSPIENYIEKFLELTHLVPWNDATMKTVVWSGMDFGILEWNLLLQVPVGAATCTLVQYLGYVLWLSGLSLTVGEVDEDAIST